MNEYRCTRPDAYEPGSPGHEEPKARQGYYIRANDEAGAMTIMRARFPEDSSFDVELGKEVK